jgi:hypothetical protein
MIKNLEKKEMNYSEITSNRVITNSIQYKKEYLTQLKKLTNNELAEQFNSKVGIQYFNFTIQGFMGAMRKELQSREIDYTEIGNEKTISYANKIKIINGKITKRSKV